MRNWAARSVKVVAGSRAVLSAFQQSEQSANRSLVSVSAPRARDGRGAAALAAATAAAMVTAGQGRAAGRAGPAAASVTLCASGTRKFSTEAVKAQPSAIVVENVEIEKPLTDYRQYKAARLRNNMQVMVVSDPKCDKAAAALSVGVGSLHDPREIQGLAHFCEHMLFLGTEKYPKEDEYNQYLAKNGGGSNAYTAEALTNYFFGVKPDALPGALDRFAQFFVAPLFTESATERELQAVDSEHSKNIQQDGWRMSQLARNSADPSHPLNHFMTGNSQTLRDLPAKAGVDVRKALLKFHDRYYSAHLMRLVIVGREEPEELLAYANELFSAVPENNVVVPRDAAIGDGRPAFPPDRLGRMVHVVPVNDIRSASFEFLLPSQKGSWRSKPEGYVSHIVGHEGKGSLLAALKSRGLATELSAGGSLDEAGAHFFTVSVMLTEKGQQEIGTVGELLFAYLRLLREAGPDEALWKELQKLSDMGFKFRSLSDAMSTASGLAHSLQEHAPETALSASAKVWEYEPDKIEELVDMLRCDRLRLVLASKAFEPLCTEEERWYGTKHADQPLQDELRARWEHAGAVPVEDLQLPVPNPFVPEDLALRPSEPQQESTAPQLLSMDGEDAAMQCVTAYFRKDEEFKLPKAVCAFMIYCPFAMESVETRTLAELWCLAVREELNEFAYDAQCAGLSYSLQAAPFGMILSVGGYNDKLPALLSAVAQKMATFVDVSDHTYQITRTILERGLANAAVRSAPYSQAMSHESCLLSQPAQTFDERLAALRAVESHTALSGTNRKLLDRCHIECLLQGNLTSLEARDLVRSFVNPLRIAHPLNELPPMGTAALPPGLTVLERAGTNPEERNGAVVMSLQSAESSLSNRCLVQLTSQVLSQRFFDELRTKQQLGYIVSASSCGERHGFVGLRFLVQSERPPRYVVGQVSQWFKEACTYLIEDFSEAEFLEYRAALVSKLRERPKSLNEEFGRNWAEVSSRTFSFGEREAMAVFLEGLALEDMKRFVGEHLVQSPASCVLVAPAGDTGPDTNAAAVPALHADRVWTTEDVKAFRQDARWRYRNSTITRQRARL